MVIAALLSLAVVWWYYGGFNGRLVEFEQLSGETAEYQVDINTADWPELVALPGIGEKLAKRIIDSRLEQGAFKTHEDLCRVRDIGPKTLERIKPHLLPIGPESQTSIVIPANMAPHH